MGEKPSEKITSTMVLAVLAIILGAHFFLPAAILDKKAYTPAYILAILNIVFLGFTSLLIAYLAARSYIRSGATGILLLGGGALAFGTASIMSEWFLYAGGGSNIADTVYTTSALLTGCLYFGATISVLADWPLRDDALRRKTKLKIGYALVLCVVMVLAWAAFAELFPAFFTEGQGPSMVRQVVAGISSTLLFIAGLHILIFYAVKRTVFLFWYALALMMIAEGLLAAVLQRSDFGLIGWTGRFAQYLGGLYLLIAASYLVRQRSLDHILSDLLNKPAALYASLFENSMEGIVLAVENGPLLAANAQALGMLGFGAAEVRRLRLRDLLNEEDPGTSDLLREHGCGSHFRGELSMVRKDGGTFKAEIASSIFEDHQGTHLKALLFHDITPRKQAEELIRQSLEEKETLLQEIHHRVKNNMQIIISLLNLQSAGIQDETVKVLVKESSSRVNAMALIHNHLYQSSSLSDIDLHQYFKSLAGSLANMYRAPGVDIEVTASDVKLSMDQAIPCGLIINELISNALKYAFPCGRRGLIRIEALRTEDHYLIHISDNGVGLPEAVLDGKTESLGLKLTRGLAENQLGGKISVTRDQGTRFTIEIPTEC